MCFSASASFGVSVVIGAVGIATIKKARSPGQIRLASIPLLFAVQQAAEGMLWIGLTGAASDSWKHFPAYIFLIFAHLVWPVWVPLSVLLLERDRDRRTIIKVILGLGIAISLYLLYCLIAYDVSAAIHDGHILYRLNFPMSFTWISGVLYFIPTVAPLFVSSVKKIPVLGLCVLASFMISKIFFQEHLISVWCFFAAVISVMVLWIAGAIPNNRGVKEV